MAEPDNPLAGAGGCRVRRLCHILERPKGDLGDFYELFQTFVGLRRKTSRTVVNRRPDRKRSVDRRKHTPDENRTQEHAVLERAARTSKKKTSSFISLLAVAR